MCIFEIALSKYVSYHVKKKKEPYYTIFQQKKYTECVMSWSNDHPQFIEYKTENGFSGTRKL